MTPVGKIVKLLLALTVAGFVAMGMSGCKKAQSEAPTAGKAAASVSPQNGVVDMKVTEDGFEPSQITVKKDVPVTLKVTRVTDSTCATELNVEDYGIHEKLPLNQTVRVTFTPKKTGELTYACSMGMITGKIFVE